MMNSPRKSWLVVLPCLYDSRLVSCNNKKKSIDDSISVGDAGPGFTWYQIGTNFNAIAHKLINTFVGWERASAAGIRNLAESLSRRVTPATAAY